MIGELSWVDVGFLRWTDPGQQGGGAALHLWEQQGCPELCPGIDNDAVESLWTGMRGEIRMDNVSWVSPTHCLIKEVSSDN